MARPRSAEARSKVLAAASELMAERGVATWTVDEVAQRSGVAKTTIYRHWPERTGLIVDAVNAGLLHVGAPDTGTLRGDLERWFSSTIRSQLSGNAGRIIPSLIAEAERNPDVAYLLDRIGSERARVVGQIVERAIARGELRTDLDVDTLVGIIAGPVVFQKMVRRRELTQDYIDAVLDVVLAGLRVGETSAPKRETREERSALTPSSVPT